MKTIGLIGGLSWESTTEYYRLINREVQKRLGGVHSARLLLFSFDFAAIEALQAAGKWEAAQAAIEDAALSLKRAGADCLVICSNTMHCQAEAVERAAGLPLLHIADATAAAVLAAGHRRVGLLATRYTMEQDFYKGRLMRRHDLDVLIPDEADRALVHRVIYEELVCGVVKQRSRDEYRAVIAKLVERGAEAVILGCTEIMMLVKPEHSAVPLFDTTAIHAHAAVAFALEDA
jgi:aspartate racemase